MPDKYDSIREKKEVAALSSPVREIGKLLEEDGIGNKRIKIFKKKGVKRWRKPQ